MADEEPVSWQSYAKCSWLTTEGKIGPGVMFQETGVGAERAKKLCWGTGDGVECPVRLECLTQAIVENEIFGVWGGAGQRERVRIRRVWLDTGKIRDLPGAREHYQHSRSRGNGRAG